VASLSGGALKILFNYSVLNESSTSPNIFENNQDFKGLAISQGTPETYRISIYSIVGDDTIDSTTNLSTYVNNTNLTVSIDFSEEEILKIFSRLCKKS
jgi:hypothetical protein